MVLVSHLWTFLRASLLLPLCLSLFLIYRVVYLEKSTLLTVINLDISQLEGILRQGTEVTKAWPFSSTPAGDVTTTPDPDPNTAQPGAEYSNDGGIPHLHDLCEITTWRPNLILHCHSRCGPDKSSFCGGLNNARDRLQTCVRLAIDVGATTVLIPSIAARSESALWTVDPSAVTEDVGEPVILCPEAWFSLGELRQALGKGCPQLRVESVCSTEHGLMNPSETHSPSPSPRILQMPWRPLGGHRYDIRPGHTFREDVDEEMLDIPVDESGSLLVEYGDPYIAWNYTHGHELYGVYKDLFRLVGYNESLLALGKSIMRSPQLKDASYIGVHLRGENDWPEQWGSLEEQAESYANEIKRLGERDEGISAVYVSCGNKTSIQYFRQIIEPLGYSVLDKWTVFETEWPEGLAIVESLPFDQKAVVEYETLVTGKYFLGISLSSMSVVIATARTLDEPGDFFESYVDHSDSDRETEGRRLEIRGNNHTRLLSISGIIW